MAARFQRGQGVGVTVPAHGVVCHIHAVPAGDFPYLRRQTGFARQQHMVGAGGPGNARFVLA